MIKIENILADPFSKKKLTVLGVKSFYDNCYWNFMPKIENLRNEDKWEKWEQLQNNGNISYINAPEENLAVAVRTDILKFVDFCSFRGLVLDIGVGPQKIPALYKDIKNNDFQLIGIDPLIGEQPKEYEFVLGLGEYLPFVDNCFDKIIYCGTLDHFINPKETLLESKRVLKDDGAIYIWHGEKDRNTPKPAKSHDWYEKLAIPEGAEDPFHFKRFTKENLIKDIEDCELRIVKTEIHPIDEYRRSCFFKVVK